MPNSTSPSPGGRGDKDSEQFWYHMPEAMVEVDLATGTVSYANRMAEVLLGYSAEEFGGGMDASILVTEETNRMIVERAVRLAGEKDNLLPNYQRTDEQEILESTMIRKDGSSFEAEGQGSFVLSEDGTPTGMRLLFRDITDRKRTERTLAGNAQILELIVAGALVENVLQNVCLMVEGIEKGSSCFIVLNALAALSGVSVGGVNMDALPTDQLRKVDWSQLFHNTPRDEDSTIRCCAGPQSQSPPHDLLAGLCAEGFGHLRATPIGAGDGIVKGAVVLLSPAASFTDTQDHESAEQAARLAGMAIQRHQDAESLRKSEGRYRAVAERASDVIFTLDASGRFTSINPAGVALTGYSHDEIIELNVADVLAPESARLTANTLQRTSDGQLDARPFQVTVRLADGSEVPFEISIQAFEDDGSAAGFQGIGRDIRARMEAEEAVRENERLISGLLERSPVSIWVWDREGTIKSVLGLDADRVADSIVGQSILTDVFKDNAPQRANAERALHGETVCCEFESGGRSYEMTFSPIFDADGKPDGVIVTNIDITEQTQIGAEAARLEGELRHSHRLESIGRLASGVAHDFNNILAVTMGSASLISGQLDNDSPIQRDIEAIIQATERAAALTQQLLAFGGKQELRPQLVDIGVLAEGMGNFVQRVLRSDIELSVTVAANLSTVHADAGQIEQVLMNLAVNARDAMPDGGTLKIDVCNETARVQASVPRGDYVVVRVSDNGMGMSKETLERVFEPFFSTKPAHLGTGLGLSTALGIVTQSGGHLLVESELGMGTTFAIYLPVSTAHAETT